ncbi:MAG: LysR family transcriptional regulator, partial [Betaproteobacteria bacterium]|nr:LysR family transcriptional regulator [Betaproteobacteria bacterium]
MISASARRLAIFKTVADLGGFNIAAEHLGIAQPSVGAHIKALEKQAGHALFHRGRGTRASLTRAGETLYTYAVEMLRQSEQASISLTGLGTASAREVVIAAQRAVSNYFLPAYLAAFAARNPAIRIVTRTGTSENVLDMVRARSVDIGLFQSLGPVPGIRSQLLSNEPLAMVVAPHHPLAKKAVVTPADLAGRAFVGPLRDSHYFHMIDQVLRRQGLHDIHFVMELQDFAAVIEMARHGAGIACEMLCCVKNEINAGLLVQLKFAGAQASMQIRCANLSPKSEPVRQLIEIMRGGG